EKRRVVPDLSGVDPRLQPLLRAMLQPDPAFRIGSMAEVRDWRPPVRAERPAHERTVVRSEPQPARHQPTPTPRVQLPKSAAPKRSGRRGGLVFAAIAVGAIAAGAFGGWWYVEDRLGDWYKPPPETAHVLPSPPEAAKSGQGETETSKDRKSTRLN